MLAPENAATGCWPGKNDAQTQTLSSASRAPTGARSSV